MENVHRILFKVQPERGLGLIRFVRRDLISSSGGGKVNGEKKAPGHQKRIWLGCWGLQQQQKAEEEEGPFATTHQRLRNDYNCTTLSAVQLYNYSCTVQYVVQL